MKKVTLVISVLFGSFTSAFALQLAPLAALLGPAIIEAKVRTEGHQYHGVDVAMSEYLAADPSLKGYNPRVERVEDEEMVGFKIVLSNVPEIECNSFFEFPETYRRVVVNGRDAATSESACVGLNEVEAYPSP
ncbi:hypothetical protein [Rhizobium mongolense]|uniref:Uncharacterized protein n=2 Tax=Rhizobium mongolense TaxID=57676 RepID=A0ABR6IJC6_9HYPH|nr:hypothetical protein [Rhizobium mongolense]MBB4227977.1 hypothetical protein [Rhizobium mongolense]TVZ64871.1 hypothetical protein BCL32_5142 [Rhizobium mongolense USDA 1844]